MLYIGCDHAGFETKECLKKQFDKEGISYVDLSAKYTPKDDYPDHAKAVTKEILKDIKRKKQSRGILICGTGIGMSISANKVKGIRAALVTDEYSAVSSKEHNNANVLVLRGREFSKVKAAKLAKLWLNTTFSNATRHKRRISKIE